MDSSTGLQVVSSLIPASGSGQTPDSAPSLKEITVSQKVDARQRAAGFVLANLEASNDAADVSLSLGDKYKSLSISAQKIIAQLNEILQGKLPEGIESLSPEDVTPERTADTIVTGITAMYSNYVKSNPELSPEEALTRFMAAARSGVSQGYDSATGTLESLGAFEFDGVKAGVEQTRELIEKKLQEFESTQRKALGGDTEAVKTGVADSVSVEVLTQGGGSLYQASPATFTGGTSLNFVA